jgi:hypothetical protein
MARIDIVEILPRNDDLILALNSGSSSLKFGVYRHAAGDSDEKPLLIGSAEGIGHSNGTLQIFSSGGNPLVVREAIHESQSDALAALAVGVRDHIHAAPVAVGHRVVHGGPELRSHQLITPQVLGQLRSATHFAPLHIPQARLQFCLWPSRRQSLWPSTMDAATRSIIATRMVTGAMDAATTTTAIPMRTVITSAVGTPLITQVSRPAWPSAIVFLPDWSAN